jgi:hypothetical protein
VVVAPVITQAPSSTQLSPTIISLTMAAAATDPIAYSWQLVSGPSGADAPQIGNDDQQTADVNVQAAGNYVFAGTATDEATGLSATSDVPVSVTQAATSITVSPDPVVATADESYDDLPTIAATELDQFGQSMTSQPSFTYSVTDPTLGSVNGQDLFDPSGYNLGTSTVQASADGLIGTAPLFVYAGDGDFGVDPFDGLRNKLAWGSTAPMQYPQVTFSSADGSSLVFEGEGGAEADIIPSDPSGTSVQLTADFTTAVDDLFIQMDAQQGGYRATESPISVDVYTNGAYATTLTSQNGNTEFDLSSYQDVTSINITTTGLQQGYTNEPNFAGLFTFEFKPATVGVSLGDGSANQILQASDDGTQNLVPLHLFAPPNLPNGTVLTLSTTTPDEVDVWDNADPSAGDTPLLGGDGSTSQTTWTVGTDTIPTTLYVGATQASQTVGDITFTLTALLAGATSSSPAASQPTSKTKPATATDLTIQWDGQAAGQNAISVIAGQANSVSVSAPGMDLTNATYSWTIPGDTIADYTHDNSSGFTSPTSDFLTQQSLLYYWTDGTPAGVAREVSVTVTVGGKQYTAKAEFTVTKPSASITTATDQVHGGPGHDLNGNPDYVVDFGNGPTPGITFTGSGVNAAAFPGTESWLQLVDSSSSGYVDGTGQKWIDDFNGTTGPWLNTTDPYPANPANPLSTQDSPGQPIPNSYEFWIKAESFSMYLMYTPAAAAPGFASIEVPLERADWDWSFAAVNTIGWSLLYGAYSVNPGTSVSTEPVWLHNIQGQDRYIKSN